MLRRLKGNTAEQKQEMETRFTIARRCSLAMPPSETRQHGHGLLGRISLLIREFCPPTRPWQVLKVWARLPSWRAPSCAPSALRPA